MAIKIQTSVAAILALVGAIVGGQPARAADTPVHIGVIGILAEAGLYVAQERGYFAQEGLAVEFIKDLYGPDAFPALATGQIDAVGGAFGPEVVNAIQRGIHVKLVAGMNSYIPGWDSGFLAVRKELIDSGKVKDWKDLKGLKIAVSEPRPNLTDYFASKYLANGGLTFADVTTVNVPFANMIAALKTGGVDAAHTSEPLSTVVSDVGAAVKWKPVSSYAPSGLTVAILQFGPTLLEQAPDVGDRLLTADMRGARDYNDTLKKPDGKAELAPILMKYTPVKDRGLYDRIAWAYADPDAAIDMAGLQDMATYYATHAGPNAGDVKTLVEDRFRQAALKRLGPYKK